MALIQDLDRLLQLEDRALNAADMAALRFTIANETHALVPYRQAALFDLTGPRMQLVCASGLISVAEDSPFSVWLTQFAMRLPRDPHAFRLDRGDAAQSDQDAWSEWLPEHLLVVPLVDKSEVLLGMALYARETEWRDEDVALLARLHVVYSHCFMALSRASQSRWRNILLQWPRKKVLLIVGLVVAAMFIPVRLSALAPAEVIALNSIAVSAPQDGVVGGFGVSPNGVVKKGDVLFSLDDSVLLNRREVARRALEVAKVDAHVAQQRAFDDVKGRADLALLTGRVREKEAELAAAQALAERVEVRADKAGVVIFSDVNDWIGRPVQTGERVMQLAQPEDAGVLVWLPVADAINLEPGASVQLFLHTEPLNPRSATLLESSYQAAPGPDDIAAYRLRARFLPGEDLPRIGHRGTARLTGQWVSLGYYLFRRPFAALREWTGL